MLNVYDGVLKIINPKLYNSPYKVNIDEVRKVLGNFRIRSRISFMKNLLTLEIKEMTDEMLFCNSNVGAMYIPCENKIYLWEEDDYEILNHELFHTASSRYNYLFKVSNDGVVDRFDEIECINEGITEYFYLKSKGKSISIFDYQLELFIVEILVFIYGEKILRPYLEIKNKKFYRQFDEYEEIVRWINRCLDGMIIKQTAEDYRLEYLLFLELFPDDLSRDNLDEFKLNEDTSTSIQEFYEDNALLYSKFNELVVDNDIDLFNYNYSDINREYYDKWEMEYISKVNKIFNDIMSNLIIMAYSKGLNTEEIRSFILSSYNNKDDRFKQVYGDILNEILENKDKRVYNRGR